VPRGRWIFNIAVVWAATGLWHGAAWNFVAWGTSTLASRIFLDRPMMKRRTPSDVLAVLCVRFSSCPAMSA